MFGMRISATVVDHRHPSRGRQFQLSTPRPAIPSALLPGRMLGRRKVAKHWVGA